MNDFVRLYEAIAACEAPEGTQVDDVLAEFQERYRAAAPRGLGIQVGHEATEVPVLGDYVEDPRFGHRGRVYQIHDTCPQGEFWLSQQRDQTVRQHVDEPWVSVLVHNGGSIVVPIAKVKILEPFDFANDYAGVYFREAPRG